MKRANTTSACIFERGVAMKTLLVMLVPLASSAVAQPSGTFTVTGSMTAPRSRHTATLLPDGRVLIAGGEVFPETLSGAELYDPRTGTFSATGNMTTPRSRHTATLLPDGRVLIAGGWFPTNATALTSAELYDPRSGTFTGTGEMSSPAPKFTIGKWAPGSQASATLLQNGKVLLAGSCYATFGCSPVVGAAELYDPETGTFAATGNSNFEGGDTATLLPNGRVLITRGNDPEGPYPSWAELYDPSTGAFSATGYPTTNQPGPTATLLMNGKVLLAGGDWGYGSGSPIAELYDPASGVFSRTADLTSGRLQHSTTLLPDGGVLFAGGHIVRGDSAEIYNPREGSFRRTATMTVARELHTATLLNDGTDRQPRGGPRR